LPLHYAQEVCAYWLNKYDWRQREAQLNRFPQFTTMIDGLAIHFLHVRSPHSNALPLVMSHGWPGSIVEFHKVIEPLTNPSAHGGDAVDAFHLECPSLPGFGFSEKPSSTGWKVPRIARAWSDLMSRLGYKRYAAQGGDWGSAVTTYIGIQDPANCKGILDTREVPGLDRLRRASGKCTDSRRDARQRNAVLAAGNSSFFCTPVLGKHGKLSLNGSDYYSGGLLDFSKGAFQDI
jgi:pimeloyl-ACP methyl ester carboxylesterase